MSEEHADIVQMTTVPRHGVMTLRSSSELEIRSSGQIFQHTQSMKTKLLIILAILALASVDAGLAGGCTTEAGYGRGYYGGRRYYFGWILPMARRMAVVRRRL